MRPDFDPDPADLGARDGVRHRRRVDELDADAFERARERIEDGLEWGVGALIEREGRVLLVREDGRWLLPGGQVESGESHAEALTRELREETGLDVSPGDLRAVTEVDLVNDGERVGFCFAIYEATLDEETGRGAPEPVVTDDPGLPGEDIEAVEWFETLPQDTLDRELIDALR